jgi:hypothetical protein
MKTTKYDYLAYKQMSNRGELTLGIANHKAVKYVEWLPLPQRIAILLWMWVAILMVPSGFILGYLYNWWWLLLVPTSGALWRANGQTASEFVSKHADENGWLYTLIDGDDAWVYKMADGKLIHGIRSGNKNEQAAVDDFDVVGAYGAFLENSTLSPTCVEDESKLPFSKERIKTAIYNLLRNQSDTSTQNALITGLLSLPNWQHGVGETRIGVSLELINSKQGIKEKAMTIHEAGKEFRKWKPIVEEETQQLIQELERMGVSFAGDVEISSSSVEPALANASCSVSSGNVDRVQIQEASSNPNARSIQTSSTGKSPPREPAFSKGLKLTLPDAATYNSGWISVSSPTLSASQFCVTGVASQPQPYGVPLDRLEAALKSGHMTTERDGNTLIGRQDGITTRISVDQPADRKTEDGAIQAVITIRTELPSELSSVIAKPRFICDLNRMTTIGALIIEDKRLVIGSRITLYEKEDAWDLQALLVISAALSSAQSMLGAIHWALTKERRVDGIDIASKWSDYDLEEVRGYLSKISVCTAGKGGVTAEFGLHFGSMSAVQGDQDTALWKLITDQPHPQAGGGLFCLLEMPHQASDADQLDLIVQQLNTMEMAPLDLPPHIGAWCVGTLGNNPAYVTFLPNLLHEKPGIAVNVSVWAMARAQWANAMLASLGLKAPTRQGKPRTTVDLGLAKPADPIYKSGPMVSAIRSPQSTPATPPSTGGAAQPGLLSKIRSAPPDAPIYSRGFVIGSYRSTPSAPSTKTKDSQPKK